MEQPRTLIVVAMESELRHARAELTDVREYSIGPWSATDGYLGSTSVTLVRSGIGMVNAAAALSSALATRSFDVVLNYGCAGAHRSDIHAGDVILAESYIHHRAVAILPDGTERYLGFRHDLADQAQTVESIPADECLIEVGRRVALSWEPEPWTGQSRIPGVFRGPITSADCWTQSTGMIEELHRTYGTLCEDMEAAALAHVTALYQLPFLAVKDISNNELHAASEHGADGPSLAEVETEVGKRAYGFLAAILRSYVE